MKTAKVFEFAKEGKSYTIKSTSKEEARKFLLDEHSIDIKNAIEIPESEWDKVKITAFGDDTDNDPFFLSLREIFSKEVTELLCTNDRGIID